MELKIEFSPAKSWITGSRGIRPRERGKTPWTGFEVSGSKSGSKKWRDRLSRGDSIESQAASEVAELSERLKALEDETESMKKALLWSVEERKVLMDEIRKQFQIMLMNEESSIVKLLEDWRVRTSLPEILNTDRNPALVTRELRINATAFREVTGFRGQNKFHHD